LPKTWTTSRSYFWRASNFWQSKNGTKLSMKIRQQFWKGIKRKSVEEITCYFLASVWFTDNTVNISLNETPSMTHSI
jgi:hypothetical protein